MLFGYLQILFKFNIFKIFQNTPSECQRVKIQIWVQVVRKSYQHTVFSGADPGFLERGSYVLSGGGLLC